jgi:Domain of unknown function (DUF4394)
MTTTPLLQRRWPQALAALTLACTGLAHANNPACEATPDHRTYALTASQQLVYVKTCKPGKTWPVGTISGLAGEDSRLVGIDFRVQDGLLYGVGSGGGIYTLDLATAVASKVSQLTVPLSGTQFGVDFNPAANALRIISDAGQNLRHPFATPEPRTTFADLALNYTAGTTATGVVAAAYTNNDLDLNTGTALFDVDAALAQVVAQLPANNGSLSTMGKLTVTPTGPVGFDIYSPLGGAAAKNNIGLLSMTVSGTPALYKVDLLTGKASMIAKTSEALVDIAASL